jgi:hypothetical protein
VFRDISDTNDPDLQDIIDQHQLGNKLRAPSTCHELMGRTRFIPKILKRNTFGIGEVTINQIVVYLGVSSVMAQSSSSHKLGVVKEYSAQRNITT